METHNHNENEEGNIRFICPGCVQEQKEKWFKENHLIMPGDYVKAEIRGYAADGSEASEHMWTLVETVGETSFIGKLSNVPQTLIDIELHDEIQVFRTDVWEHIKDKNRC